MGNTTGVLFRVTTWGESHGPALGCVIDGCPPRLALDEAVLARDLARRRPGQSAITTERKEEDRPRILSGVHEVTTTGAPISILLESADQRSQDYAQLAQVYRPSHADYTYDAKYGHRDPRGGGRASARETAARVAAGAVARRLLAERAGVEVLAWVDAVGEVALAANDVDPLAITLAQVDAHPTRCPVPDVATRMETAIATARGDQDSLGGVVRCVARGVPPGWGDPVFDKLEADLAKAMLSIPAARGFELGDGFAGARRRGSETNDPFVPGDAPGSVKPARVDGGGTLGGISSGAPILLRVAFKPTSTIGKPQATVDRQGNPTTLAASGRHDPCVVPRAVAVVEAMTLLVLADHFLRHEAQCGRAVTGAGPLAGDARFASGITAP